MPKSTLSGRIGIYMRLSRDDEKAGESISIEHQRIILKKFAEENGGIIVDEYVDDGFSGTNFDRPGVKRLLADAQAGRIDTIIVKDLSRFGRNYIQVGQYIDYIFPAYGIRFIALGDHVDTADRASAAMDMMPLMNVFNEWHAANTSKKIRAVFEASQRVGKYTNWNYPYGYKAGNDEKRTAVIDEEAAAVVRRIYDLRLQGDSARTIAGILNGEGIPNPAAYYTRLDGGKRQRSCSPLWPPQTVRRILSDPTYLGSTLQHRTARISYKNHKVVHVPKSEWIVTEHAHEAIVSEEIWDKVQATYASRRGRSDKAGRVHALSGLLACPDCGKKLKLKTAKNARACYVCRTYADLGKKYCSSHRIDEETLERLLLEDLRSLLGAAEIDGAKAEERFLKALKTRSGQSKTSDEKQLKALQSRLAELEKLTQAAFEEKVLGCLPQDVFSDLCEKYQSERREILQAKSKLEGRLCRPDPDGKAAEAYARRFRRYASAEILTREMCLQLIDRITVGEKYENGEREIHIYYKFFADGTRRGEDQ